MQQLQLRKGYIRCINCAHIFDGYEAVVPAGPKDPVVSPGAVAHAPGQAEPQFSASGNSNDQKPSGPSFVIPASSQAASGVPIRTRDDGGEVVEHEPFTVRDTEPGPETHRHTLTDEPGSALGATGSGLYIEPREGRISAPDLPQQDSAESSLWGVFWTLLVMVGLALAVLQAAYIYRVQLASEIPALRPTLERYCEVLGCSVDYPRRLAQIAIMDSSLQAIRGGEGARANGNHMKLDVVLRNNYDKPQQWPSLSVELVDFSGAVAARRLLAPSDYLPEISLQQPFPAKSEVRVSVPITVDGAQINGYQLDKFFP